MMEETGTVLSIAGSSMEVRFERTDACQRCGACQLGKDGEMLMTMPNTIEAKAGDRVAVSLGEGQVLKASLLAYGLPLAGLLAGLLLGWFGAPLFPALSRDLCAVIGAALFTVAAFALNHVLEPKRRGTGAYQPQPARVVSEEEEKDAHDG